MGTHGLMSVPRLGSTTNIGHSLLNGFFKEIILWLILYFGRDFGRLFSVKGLLGNFCFLSLLAGFSNRTRKTYLATSSFRAPNIGMESLLITEFRQRYHATVTHSERWTGLILIMCLALKRAAFKLNLL